MNIDALAVRHYQYQCCSTGRYCFRFPQMKHTCRTFESGGTEQNKYTLASANCTLLLKPSPSPHPSPHPFPHRASSASTTGEHSQNVLSHKFEASNFSEQA